MMTKGRIGILLVLSLVASPLYGAARGRAVSLKACQERLRTCQPGTYPHEIAALHGITRILGYMIDRGGGDVVLIGRSDPDRPALHFEDFVVALRNAYLRYVRREGDMSYYSAPSCSIDPDPATMEKLAGIAEKILAGPAEEEMKKLVERWGQTCEAPQAVRVLGVPPTSRFAKVMVEADYELKSLADGSSKSAVEGLVSHTDMVLRACRSDFLNDRPISVAPSTMNRFWFTMGEVRMVKRDGMVLVKECAVRLLTEHQLLARGGERRRAATPDRLAERFAARLTEAFGELAAHYPLYAELDNLFRFAFIAKALRFGDAFRRAGLDLAWLLDNYAVPELAAPSTLPGRHSFAETRVKRDMGDRYAVGHFRLPSCGGVDMDVDIDSVMVSEDGAEKVPHIRKAVEESRPAGKAVSWEFELDWEEE